MNRRTQPNRGPKSEMGNVTADEFLRECGPHAAEEVLRLARWLRSDNPAQDKALWQRQDVGEFGNFPVRVAPSIVTRSEAELFSLSLPRFALRVALDGRGSFVNCRRTATFADQARRWGHRTAGQGNVTLADIRELRPSEKLPDNRFRLARRCPGWILHTNSCIGDSVVALPERLEGAVLVNPNVHAVYGPNPGGDKRLQSTPFLRHIPLSGGGLCAQACSFMATMLMHSQARNLFGPAEITRLAGEPGATEYRISGLDLYAIRRYFQSPQVGLNAFVHLEPAPDDFRLALQAAIDSSLPVILPLDAGRMNSVPAAGANPRESIRAFNGVPPEASLRQLQRQPHAVTVVGRLGDVFLLNDPLLYPFMQAKSDHLLDAALYGESMEDLHLLRGLFVAITPGRVRLPMLNQADNLAEPESGGILGVVALTEIAAACLRMPAHQIPVADTTLLLTPRSQVGNAVVRVGPTEWDEDYSAAAEGVIASLELDPDHLLWVHRFADATYIWDAEAEPPYSQCLREASTVSSVPDALLLALSVTNGRCSAVHRVDRPAVGAVAATGMKADPCQAQLVPSASILAPKVKGAVITSFDPKGLKQSGRRRLPWNNIELYAFMQLDAETLQQTSLGRLRLSLGDFLQFARYTSGVYSHNLFRRFPWLGLLSPSRLLRGVQGRQTLVPRSRQPLSARWPITSACERMALLGTGEKAVGSALAFVKSHLHSEHVVVGLATFLPEITSHRPADRAKATAALLFACHLAEEIRKGSDLPSIVVEAVAGSAVDGVWPGRSTRPDAEPRTIFVGNVLEQSAGYERLARELDKVVRSVDRLQVRIALELEPGPLYLLHDLETLCGFLQWCNDNSKSLHKDFERTVGLNLDVAHWSLAGITPDQVMECAQVRQRIFHCHVADFSKGHLGDSPLGTFHADPAFFQAWLAVLAKDGTTSEPAFFSGYSSCELEAAQNWRTLTKSLNFMKDDLGIDCS